MKKYIIIVGILLIYLVAVLFIFGEKKSSKSTKKNDNKVDEKYILFNDDIVFQKKENNFITINNKKYLEKKYYTFSDGKYIGNYYYRYNDFKGYLYDDDYNPVNYDGKLVLNNYDKNMKICDLNEKEIDKKDIEITNKILKKYNINYDENNMSLIKYNCDINNDNNIDSIYSLSTEYRYGNDPISLVFMNVNDKNIDLSSTTDAVLLEILDIDGDDKLEIITTEIYNQRSCYRILKYQNNNIKILKEC